MNTFFNQYSYILISAGVLILSALVLRRMLASRKATSAALLSLLVLSVAGFFLLRPGAGDVDSAASAEATLRNGKPTFLEFFSNYCIGCLAIRPVVDEYAAALGDDFNIMRIDIHSEAGRDLRERYAFSYTPEFILFDSSGSEIWRGHNPPPHEQVNSVLAQRTGTENQ